MPLRDAGDWQGHREGVPLSRCSIRVSTAWYFEPETARIVIPAVTHNAANRHARHNDLLTPCRFAALRLAALPPCRLTPRHA
jgi:hypothetical protein